MAGEGDEVKAVSALIVLDTNRHRLKILVFESRGHSVDAGGTAEGQRADDLLVGYYSDKNDLVTLQVYNASGSVIYRQTNKITEGMNILLLPANTLRHKSLSHRNK